MFILNKQVKIWQLIDVKKYDEDLFTSFFDFTNKFEIRKIRIQFHWSLSNEDVINICAKIEDKISRIIFPNDVSCFI